MDDNRTVELSDEQVAALRGLTADGVISAEQERAVRAALAGGGRAPVRRGEQVVEVVGYVGGGLLLGGAALLVGASWDDLGRSGRVTLLVATTLVLIVAGVVIAGGPQAVLGSRATPVRHRVVGVLFALSSATAALAAGVAVESRDFLVGGSVGLVVAVAAYAVVRAAVCLLAAAVSSALVVGALVGELTAETPLTVGLALFGLGAVWFGLAVGRVVRHRGLAFAVGAVIALIGAQQPFGTSGWSYAMTAALALASFALYLREQVIVLVVAGVVATTVVVPQAVWDWTDGAVSGGWLLLVGGSVLLVASGVGLRLRSGAE